MLLPRPADGGSPNSSVFDLPVQTASPAYPPFLSTRPVIDQSQSAQKHSFLVISGGTGGNAICSAFGHDACYVLPVSDDGGSSSEIIRVLGGPSIGDIRSRLIRLIPSSPPSSALDAIRNILAYRLPSKCSEREAREEWREIVEGKSHLWAGVPKDRKETIRGFLVYFESEILKRAHKDFSFLNGSIGNYFLAAAQSFFRSLPSAIFLFSSITNSQADILPAIVTSHTVTIAAELQDGGRVVGQCEISHPVVGAESVNAPPSIQFNDVAESQDYLLSPTDGMGETFARPKNVMFGAEGKDSYYPLSSRIQRIYYLNAYGNEVYPTPNPDFIARLGSSDVLVYSCGSLWTSIMPNLALRGVASAIAGSQTLRAKILLLNSKNDRETEGYTAVDYVLDIARTLNTHYPGQPYSLGNVNTRYPVSAFVTDVVYLKGTHVPMDIDHMTLMGVRCTAVEGELGKSDVPLFTARSVQQAVEEIMANERR